MISPENESKSDCGEGTENVIEGDIAACAVGNNAGDGAGNKGSDHIP